MFYETAQYPFVQPLQAAWQTLRDELQALSTSDFVKWPERSIYDGDWTVFALYRLGEAISAHTALCPQTAALLAQVPGLVNAGFSSLAPGTYIGPNVGYTQEVLRCHVGLITPENCAPRVDKEARGAVGPQAHASSLTTPKSMRPGTAATRRAWCCYSTSNEIPQSR